MLPLAARAQAPRPASGKLRRERAAKPVTGLPRCQYSQAGWVVGVSVALGNLAAPAADDFPAAATAGHPAVAVASLATPASPAAMAQPVTSPVLRQRWLSQLRRRCSGGHGRRIVRGCLWRRFLSRRVWP